MGCQRKICETVIEKDADYRLIVKMNQRTLCEEMNEYFQWAVADEVESKALSQYETAEKGHGRINRWRVTASKPVERRLKTLDEHIRQVDVYLQNKAVYAQYQQQRSKSQVTFAETHHAEITLFESASRYLKGVMNGRTTLPVKAWKAEQGKLTVEKNQLTKAYFSLKDEAKNVEQIRRGVHELMKAETRRMHLTREQDIGR